MSKFECSQFALHSRRWVFSLRWIQTDCANYVRLSQMQNIRVYFELSTVQLDTDRLRSELVAVAAEAKWCLGYWRAKQRTVIIPRVSMLFSPQESRQSKIIVWTILVCYCLMRKEYDKFDAEQSPVSFISLITWLVRNSYWLNLYNRTAY